MRTLLALAAVFTSFHTTSEACGWQPPRLAVHRVTAHSVLLGDHAWRQRAFVVLGDAPKIDDAHWQQLAPLTYDSTKIAELSALPKPREITLVGASGTRVVTSDHQVALSGGWQLGANAAHTALEVPASGYAIAIDGKVPGAKWHALQYTYSNIVKVADLTLELKLADGGYSVLSEGHVLTSGQGNFLGVLDADGIRYFVIEPTRGETAAVSFGRLDQAS
jgi:hypothetical protein